MPIIHPDDHVDTTDYAALLNEQDDRATPRPQWIGSRFLNGLLALAVLCALVTVLLTLADHANHSLWVALTVFALAIACIGAYAFVSMVETISNEHATDANRGQLPYNAQQPHRSNQPADPPAEMWHLPHSGTSTRSSR